MSQIRLALALVALALLPRLGAAEEPFADLSFAAALERADEQEKLVLVDFFTTWCGPCKQLDRTTWANARVRAWLAEHAVALKIDAEREVALARRFGVHAYPTILVLHPDGRIAERLIGYRGPRQLLTELDEALAGRDAAERAAEELAASPDDPSRRLQRARELLREGLPADALFELEWCWDHSLEHEPAFHGVRLSFLLSEWARLARDYAPARDSLAERRADAERRLLAGEDAPLAASELSSIDRVTGGPERVLATWDALAERGAAGAAARAELGPHVFADLAAAERWTDALAAQPLPGYLRTLRAVGEATRTLRSERGDELRAGIYAHAAGKCALYLRALLALEESADAERVVTAMLAVDDSAATQRTLAEAAGRGGATELAAELEAGAEAAEAAAEAERAEAELEERGIGAEPTSGGPEEPGGPDEADEPDEPDGAEKTDEQDDDGHSLELVSVFRLPPARTGARAAARVSPAAVAADALELDGFEIAWSTPGPYTAVAVDPRTRETFAGRINDRCDVFDRNGDLLRTFPVPDDVALLRHARLVSPLAPERERRGADLVGFSRWNREVHAFTAQGIPLWIAGTEAGIDDVACGDVDGDGADEVLVGLNAAGLRLWTADGGPLAELGELGTVWNVATGDLDGDGTPELVHTAGGEVCVRAADGTLQTSFLLRVRAQLVHVLRPTQKDAPVSLLVAGRGGRHGPVLVCADAAGAELWHVELPTDLDGVDSLVVHPDLPLAALGSDESLAVVDLRRREVIAQARGGTRLGQIAWRAEVPGAAPALLVATGADLAALRLRP